jgi:hypothetical protein
MTILETARLRLEPFDGGHFDGLLAMQRWYGVELAAHRITREAWQGRR